MFIKIKKTKKTTYCPILSRVSMQMWFILRIVVVSALDGRWVHFESPVLDVSKWLIALLLCVYSRHFYPKTWLSGYQSAYLHFFATLIGAKMILFITRPFRINWMTLVLSRQ